MVRVWKVFCTSAAIQGERAPHSKPPFWTRLFAGVGVQVAGVLVVVMELVDVVEVVTVVLGVGWQEPMEI